MLAHSDMVCRAVSEGQNRPIGTLREPAGKQMFADTSSGRPVGAECAIRGRNPPLSHQPVLILSAYAYQKGVSLVLA